MDIKLINLQKNKLTKLNKLNMEEKKKYLDDFLYLGLGLKIIKRDIKLTDDIKDTIDFLCIDESYRLVIVELREGKFSRTIKSGLMYIDYIKEHLSEIKMLVGDAIGVDISKQVIYEPRLVILTESFNSYDYSSIKCLPYPIEAINYIFLDKNLVFVKEFQNNSLDLKKFTKPVNPIINSLNDFMLSLGDEVNIFGYNNLIVARKIKAFAFIFVDENINVILGQKQYVINNKKDLEKIETKLEKAYDEN